MSQKSSSQLPQTELTNKEKGSLPLPKEIYKHLDEHIFGQDHAKKVISVGIYNHYKRIGAMGLGKNLEEGSVLRRMLSAFVGFRKPNVERIAKSNLILIGPTGCGKTELARSVAKYLDVPFVICDCTTLTETGYYGDDVDQTLTELYLNAKQDVAKTEMGIVFLDEVDKIRASAISCRDIGGLGVQQALLRMIEGSKMFIPTTVSGKKSDAQKVLINTTNILFIAAGAFVGLDAIVRKRLKEELKSEEVSESPSVTDENDDTWLNHIDTCDLVKYRMTPEFVGRFPMIVPVKPIDEQTLVSILTMPKNSILGQYEELFRIDNAELIVSEDAIAEIARVSVAKKTGVRGLRATLESILQDSMFEVPDSDINQVLVTRNAVLDREQVEYKRRTV